MVNLTAIPSALLDSCVTRKSTQTERSHQLDIDSCVTRKSTPTERSHQLDIDSCVTRKSTQTERSHQLDIDSCVTSKSTQTERSHQLDIDSCVTCKSTQTERSHQLDIDSCVTSKSTQTGRLYTKWSSKDARCCMAEFKDYINDTSQTGTKGHLPSKSKVEAFLFKYTDVLQGVQGIKVKIQLVKTKVFKENQNIV
ncbi:uncharacterized protein [Asterias amurensis]|uniref:uncharacterized protein n=1 Tax=Asterias amurensis TaxID=7602 RepID=UPI003AB25603